MPMAHRYLVSYTMNEMNANDFLQATKNLTGKVIFGQIMIIDATVIHIASWTTLITPEGSNGVVAKQKATTRAAELQGIRQMSTRWLVHHRRRSISL